MDLYTRMIVGWYMDSRMTKDLVLKALDRAYARHKPTAHIQTVHHSDRDSQYVPFVAVLDNEHGPHFI